MRSRRARTLLLACGVCAAVLPAVAGQPDAGGLPPGFGDPKATPPTPTPPPPTATPVPSVTPDTVPDVAEPVAPTVPERLPVEETTDSALTDLQLLPPPPPPPFYDLPEGSERPVDQVGLIGPGNRGLASDAFGDANGVFLATLMQRLDAPLASRWGQIMLRRALMSRVAAPAMLDPVVFVAERVRLLVRMGEADAARMLAQAVDVNNYNPAMVRAVYEASLASADPAGLCPVVQRGREWFDDPVWPMADAMCAAMEGEAARASTLLDEARAKGARGIDYLLAEKIVGAGSNTGRSIEIQWDEVPELTPWRFGLASAAGAAAPDRLIGAAPARMQAWYARAPMVPITDRLAAADVAASLGAFSTSSLVNAHALALDLREQGGAPEEENAGETPTGRLRAAYAGEMAARVVALRGLWDEAGDDAARRHARLILGAAAAAQIPASGDYSGDADDIVASLFTAGMDREAALWTDIVEDGGDASLAWALLAVGAPRVAVGIDAGRIGDFAGEQGGELRSRMLAAALAGLGRTDDGTAQALGVDTGRGDAWTDALGRAAAARQPGTVVLLAAVGLQAADWSAVPPEHLYRIVRALREVGLDYEARMIAAEALTRL